MPKASICTQCGGRDRVVVKICVTSDSTIISICRFCYDILECPEEQIVKHIKVCPLIPRYTHICRYDEGQTHYNRVWKTMRHRMDVCPDCQGYILYKVDAYIVTCLICGTEEPVVSYYDTVHTSDICRTLRLDLPLCYCKLFSIDFLTFELEGELTFE